MAWGAKKQGLDEISKRLRENDPSLGSLTLFHTRRCNEDDLDMLFTALQGNTVLKELNILPCHAITPLSAAKAAQMLSHGPPLQSLSLGHRDFGDGGLVALAPGLSGGRLVRLDLDNKGITPAGVECLANNLGRLKEINLSRNLVGDRGLSSLLSSPAASSLEVLTLQSCGVTLSNPLSKEEVTAESLTIVDLSGNVLKKSPSLAALASSLSKLKELRLRDCELSVEAASSLLSAISSSLGGSGSSIKALDVSGRQSFGDEALTLAHGPLLESLNLGRHYNSLEQGAEGVRSLSSEVITLLGVCRLSSAFPSLISLDLTGASLKGEYAQCREAFNALGSNCKRLVQLRLVGTGLGDEGAMAFASASESFESLEELSISACGLTANGLGDFFSAIQGSSSKVPKVSSIECGANASGDEEAVNLAIQSLVEARPKLAVHCRNTLEGEGKGEES